MNIVLLARKRLQPDEDATQDKEPLVVLRETKIPKVRRLRAQVILPQLIIVELSTS